MKEKLDRVMNERTRKGVTQINMFTYLLLPGWPLHLLPFITNEYIHNVMLHVLSE